MSRLECPLCGRENTTIISHEKWKFELFCMNCGESVTVVKKNKIEIESANLGIFDGETFSG